MFNFMNLPPYIPDYTNFVPGVSQILYSGPYYDNREIEAATKALTTGTWLAAGPYVARFQNEFSRRFNAKHSYMLNSGSSANLVMIAALKRRFGWKDGDEVLVSPVGFATTISAIAQNGLQPIFADIDLDTTLNFDLDRVEFEIDRRLCNGRTRAIFISPVLGNPPDMDRLRQMVYRKGILLVGDNCDSLGTLWRGSLWTEFCYAHSCSFYAAHHLCTGEGGMVSSDDKSLMDIVRSFASWGRACWCVGAANLLPCGSCRKRFSDWLGDGGVTDHKYVFDNMGYNLKPLDLQGAIGLVQLEKFDEIETKRRANKLSISKIFEGSVDVRVAATEEGADPSWFGVPLICRNQAVKENLVAHLEANKIQTRPYFAGNILRHPGFRHLGNAADFPNADQALKRVFFLGCPPFYTPEVIEYIGKVFRAWSA